MFGTYFKHKESTTKDDDVICASKIENEILTKSCLRPISYKDRYGKLEDRTVKLSDLNFDGEAMTAVIQENPVTQYESKVEQFKKRREQINKERVRNRESQSNVDDNLYTAENFE